MTGRATSLWVVLAACVPATAPAPAPPAPRSAFGCSNPPRSDAATPIAISGGRAEVSLARDTPDGPHLRILAEGAPLGLVAVRIGEALHVDVEVSPDRAGTPITLFATDLPLAELGARLRPFDVHVGSVEVRPLRFAAIGGGTLEHPDQEWPTIRLYDPLPGIDPAQMAGLACRLGSPGSWAQVVGDRVFVSDVRTIHALLYAAFEPYRKRP